MAGFISVRVTKEERKQLLLIKAERHCTTLSQAVRLMMGFSRGEAESVEGADDIDSVASLVKEVILLRDRVDTSNKLIYKMSQHLGMPKIKDIPTEDLIRPLVVAPMEFRNGDQHPALPDGFMRS